MVVTVLFDLDGMCFSHVLDRHDTGASIVAWTRQELALSEKFSASCQAKNLSQRRYPTQEHVAHQGVRK